MKTLSAGFLTLALSAVVGTVFAGAAHAQTACEDYGPHVYTVSDEDTSTLRQWCAVDVNTATIEELSLVGGIGPTMAERIIAGRTFAAPLATTLQTVKGIKQKKADAFTSPHSRKDQRQAFALAVR